MQIGCSAPSSGPLIAPDSLVRIATEAEMLGFDYITVSDHVMIPTSIASRYPYSESGEFPSGAGAARLEQLTTAAFIAAATSKLRIVTSVMVVPHRPAVLTAKILATIDYLSKGRLTLGIGAGWCKEEFEAIGAPPFEDRGHVTDEWMMAVQGAVGEGRAEVRRQVREVLRRGVHAEAGAEVDPDLGRRRERPGAAAHGEVCRCLVSDRHQSAVPDGHADALQGRCGEAARPDREGRARSVGGDGWPIAFRPTRRRSRRARWTASGSCSPEARRISSATSRRWPRRA